MYFPGPPAVVFQKKTLAFEFGRAARFFRSAAICSLKTRWLIVIDDRVPRVWVKLTSIWFWKSLDLGRFYFFKTRYTCNDQGFKMKHHARNGGPKWFEPHMGFTFDIILATIAHQKQSSLCPASVKKVLSSTIGWCSKYNTLNNGNPGTYDEPQKVYGRSTQWIASQELRIVPGRRLSQKTNLSETNFKSDRGS